MLSHLYNLALDSDRKSLPLIYKDLSSLRKRNFSTKCYFTNLMYKKSAGNIHHYVDEKVYLKIAKNYYRPTGKSPLLEEKIVFQEHLKNNDIPGTKLLAKLRNGKLIIGENAYTGLKEIETQIMELTRVYESVFIKQTDTSGGSSVFKVNKGDAFNVESLSMSKDYIIEQTLIQHEALNQVNPNSINTLRVVTFKLGEQVVIPECMFRMSKGTSYLDNASAGGIFISYDIESNKLGATGYQLFKNGARSFTKHPLSNFVFKDASLPFNEEVKTLVTKAARSYSHIDSIGWDIAYTHNGPVILEGNDSPHIVMMQIASHGLLNNTIYREVFKKYLPT
ncbi:MAG TPA: sugar-transfer associated ATP-grasp domain-containing protein [Flavobacteriaceae bacterium]|nr:sugar-transfer associated ATP-grasp domain-containing protein [Flavobacteriaceae bacterium]